MTNATVQLEGTNGRSSTEGEGPAEEEGAAGVPSAEDYLLQHVVSRPH